MTASPLLLGDALAHRCAQVLYRCLEEVGSTKGALYLRIPGQGSFEVVSFYGWPRGARPPVTIPEGHPLLVHAHRERRSFVLNDASDLSELAGFGQGGECPRYLITPVFLAGDWVGLLIQRDRIKGGTFDATRDDPPTLAICQDLLEALGEFRFYGTSPRHSVRETLPPLPPLPPPPPPSPALLLPVHASRHLSPGFVPQDLPTAAAIIAEVVPAPAHLLPAAPAAAPGMYAPGASLPTGRLGSPERIYGFAEGSDGYSVLPWEANHLLSTLVAPAPPAHKRGLVPPEQRAFYWEIAGLLTQILSAAVVTLWIDDPEAIRPLLVYSNMPLSPELQQQMLAKAAFHLPSVREQDLRVITRVDMPQAAQLTGSFATYMPLLLNETIRGHDLLMVYRQEDQPFSVAENKVIQHLGRILGLHLQEARLHERYHLAFLSVTHRILKSSQSRIPSLRAHSLATARLARDLALKLELSTEEVEAVSIAAILHDVGLLMLDPQMLAKVDLTTEEKKKVHSHPEMAEVYLKDLRFPFDAVKMIRHHHERWDGRGYPDGLREAGIPIGSRIIGLIEAYEVMTSGKSYRRPRGYRQVLEELESQGGAQFDPMVVKAFGELMTRKGERG